MKHPPPGRIYGNVAKQFRELRGSWNFKHPPPQYAYLGIKSETLYEKHKNQHGSFTRRNRRFVSKTYSPPGIWQKAYAFISSKRLEAIRSSS